MPHGVMYGIAASIFMLPIVLMCYVICCMKDDYEYEDKSAAASAPKKPASSSKREKIDWFIIFNFLRVLT